MRCWLVHCPTTLTTLVLPIIGIFVAVFPLRHYGWFSNLHLALKESASTVEIVHRFSKPFQLILHIGKFIYLVLVFLQ